MAYQVSVGGRMSSYSNLSDFEWKISRWYVGTWIGTGFQASNFTASYNFDPALGSPGGSDGKESACSVGDLSSIPGSGRSPGKGNGNPLQCSCLENSVDTGAWWATVHGVTKNGTQMSKQHFHFAHIEGTPQNYL